MVTLTVMHSLGGIPLVTSRLHAGDALIDLFGLDVESESDEALFALSVNSGLPVVYLLRKRHGDSAGG